MTSGVEKGKLGGVDMNMKHRGVSAMSAPVSAQASSSAGKHSRSLAVGASLFRFIKGEGGSTQRKIEREMEVKIVFPSSKNEEAIIIEGISVDSVTRASEQIQSIIDKAVNSRSLDYSHFISLPLAVNPHLVQKLVNFQNSILENSDASPHAKATCIPSSSSIGASRAPTLSELGIDRSIFINPKTFHLTVLMLKLWNKERVNAASEVLKSISSKVMDALDNCPISIRLKGLDLMKGSAAKAGVLYAPVEEIGNEDRLLRACQVMIDAFVEAGLVVEGDANHKLRLHATVMNVRQRKRERRGQKFNTFDARGIFNQFGSEEWGEYVISEAHLSQRFVYDANGYYHCCASIPFPESMQVD